ncbi:TonB-dependent receptor plug domain-containing protein, partial [Litorivivens sp.]|uniref:TonB-dependent receptor plug domain-containing protein n=1 Tax=Litorivivens sp. TaxID=2020868 RepID=UPI00356720F2
MKAKAFVALSAASVMVAAGSSVFAQDAAASENAPAKEARKIEEVYVTATKRSKSVRDIPISIDAFSGDMLVERGATSLEEIVKYSSGVILTKGATPDQGSVTIRGVSNSGGFFTRTVGRFYDNVSLINPSVAGVQPDIDPFDMAAV